jgi:hypothetical protein
MFWNKKNRGVVVEDISEELVPITGSRKLAVVLHNVLTPEECENLIRRATKAGFDDALVQDTNGKEVLRRDIRRCGRCIIDDRSLADDVYERITRAVSDLPELERKIARAPRIAPLPMSPSSDDTNVVVVATAVGLNERMRFLRYMPGHFFAPHRDLRYVRGPEHGARAGETSYVTVQLYLNDKFGGGVTRFLPDGGGGGDGRSGRHYDVRPKRGSVLIFDHDLVHEGSVVTDGIKYSVRTDIMFTTEPRR